MMHGGRQLYHGLQSLRHSRIFLLYIPPNVISITDGSNFLRRICFIQGEASYAAEFICFSVGREQQQKYKSKYMKKDIETYDV